MSRMRKLGLASRWSTGLFLATLAAPALLADEGALTQSEWQTAVEGFAQGEANSPSVYDISDASRCRGRWALHADMVDDGAFPALAQSLLPEALRLPNAMREVEFFYIEQRDILAYHSAFDAAERALYLALRGDRTAARRYFEALGTCYSTPETVGDDSIGDGPAEDIEGPADQHIIASSDFDEPVNQARLAFARSFAQDLKSGQSLASHFAAEFAFTYKARHRCGAVLSQRIDPLPASDIDLSIMFWVNMPGDVQGSLTSACAKHPEEEVMEAINLRALTSQWSDLEVLPDDHNFEVFVISPKGSPEFLLIHIEPHASGFVVTELEYDASDLSD